MLEVQHQQLQHQQQLLNNNWFAKLPHAYQQYIVQHAKYINVAKDQAVFRKVKKQLQQLLNRLCGLEKFR